MMTFSRVVTPTVTFPHIALSFLGFLLLVRMVEFEALNYAFGYQLSWSLLLVSRENLMNAILHLFAEVVGRRHGGECGSGNILAG